MADEKIVKVVTPASLQGVPEGSGVDQYRPSVQVPQEAVSDAPAPDREASGEPGPTVEAVQPAPATDNVSPKGVTNSPNDDVPSTDVPVNPAATPSVTADQLDESNDTPAPPASSPSEDASPSDTPAPAEVDESDSKS